MKKYVKVIAVFNTDGTIVPRVIFLDNGSILEINRVSEPSRAACMTAGVVGLRYVCIAAGKRFDLYKEDDRWFIDEKTN